MFYDYVALHRKHDGQNALNLPSFLRIGTSLLLSAFHDIDF